ncbi:hypothetical protein K438DRAFT_1757333 [Mycena galopus ATCC 62051]|nr:hypothetical protein K438DRAFT_1757333 [Mycena galopus ATCC 62051]
MPTKTRHQKAKAKAEKQRRQKMNQSALSGDSTADLAARSGTASNAFATTSGSTLAVANVGVLPMTRGSERDPLPQLIGDMTRSDEQRAVSSDPRSSLASSGLPSLTPSAENSRVSPSIVLNPNNSPMAGTECSHLVPLAGSETIQQNTTGGVRSHLASIRESVERESATRNQHCTPAAMVEEVPDVDDMPVWRQNNESSRTRYRIVRMDGTIPAGRHRAYRVPVEESEVDDPRAQPGPRSSDLEDAEEGRPAGSRQARCDEKKLRRTLTATSSSTTTPQITDTEGPRNTWKDVGLYKAAVDMLGRERDMREDSATFRQRMDAFWRAERAMHAVRTEEDRVYAEKVAAEFAAEDADHNLARQLAHENEQVERVGDDRLLSTALEEQEIEAQQLEALAREARAKAESMRQQSLTTAGVTMLNEVPTVPNSRHSSVRQLRPISKAASVASSGHAPSTVMIIGDNDEPSAKEREHSVQEVPPLPPVRIIHANVELALRDRIILQRYRKADIEAMSWSHIPDQDIAWNDDGIVIDLRKTVVKKQTVSLEVPAAVLPDKQFRSPFDNGRGNAPVVESSGIGRNAGITGAPRLDHPRKENNNCQGSKMAAVAAVHANKDPDDDGSPSDSDNGDDDTSCTQCPHRKRGPVMFAGREIIEEDGDKPGQDEGLQIDVPEQFKQMHEDGPEPAEQTQEMYDSEFTLEECSEYSEYGDDEHCFHIAEENDDIPMSDGWRYFER